jgi:hypothetical protein
MIAFYPQAVNAIGFFSRYISSWQIPFFVSSWNFQSAICTSAFLFSFGILE